MSQKSPALIALFAVLTAVSGLISVPAGPVPLTLQTLFSLLSGALIGPYAGALSQLVYIIMGISGLPVFSAGGSGPGHLIGPTGGYLVGFIGASYVTGLIVERGRVLTGFILGMVVIYMIGIPWLRIQTDISWRQAFLIGGAIFIPGEIIKIIVAWGIYRKLKKVGITAELK